MFFSHLAELLTRAESLKTPIQLDSELSFTIAFSSISLLSQTILTRKKNFPAL